MILLAPLSPRAIKGPAILGRYLCTVLYLLYAGIKFLTLKHQSCGTGRGGRWPMNRVNRVLGNSGVKIDAGLGRFKTLNIQKKLFEAGLYCY